MSTTTYSVTGMSCEHCTNAVTTQLRGLNGVTGVRIDLVPGGASRVTITSSTPLAGAAVSAAGTR
jgi:copper chaperone